jgi:hypothetical protein
MTDVTADNFLGHIVLSALPGLQKRCREIHPVDSHISGPFPLSTPGLEAGGVGERGHNCANQEAITHSHTQHTSDLDPFHLHQAVFSSAIYTHNKATAYSLYRLAFSITYSFYRLAFSRLTHTSGWSTADFACTIGWPSDILLSH